VKHITYIALGSNVGDKLLQCRKAISEILKLDCHRLLARSSFYKTLPLGHIAQDWFVNGVIKLETELEPHKLLRSLKALESRLGRRETFRWGPRSIDLDLLFYDDKQIRSEELALPHPLLHERQFVLAPLAEIDPHLVHPVLGKTIRELLIQLKEDQGVEKILSVESSPLTHLSC
jgi:2-amino-4-hydroxy-6-hydroxymethyldihydropteridine diphosphokinase